MHDAEVLATRSAADVVHAVEKSVSMLVHVVLGGLTGAAVAATYFAMAFWISGWRAHPRFAGYDWHDWLLLSMLSVGLVLIVGGIMLSLSWFARVRQMWAALVWLLVSTVVLTLTFVGVVATIIDATSFGD